MTRQPSQVPQVSHLQQQFGQQRRQPLQSPLSQPQQTAVAPEQQIQQQMHELALEIYVRLAAELITTSLHKPDSATLRQLATDAQSAARAYYESLGVQFRDHDQER